MSYINKRTATWLGSKSRILRQLIVSLWSFITLPFMRPRLDATQLYFKKIYSGYNDDLLFDGKDYRYLHQIECVYNIDNLTARKVLDFGAGDGVLYRWLCSCNTIPKEYKGLDFANTNRNLGKNSSLINVNISEYEFEEDSLESTTSFMINVLCYINDKSFRNIIGASKTGQEFVIIDPVPGIFWDAHFDGIKLFYRKPSKVFRVLGESGWEIHNISFDYGVKIFNKHLFPLSYCVYAKKI